VPPCIFLPKVPEPSSNEFFKTMVAGCGQVGRGPRGGQCEALSAASGPVRATARTVHLSTACRRGQVCGRRATGIDSHHNLHRYGWEISAGGKVMLVGFDVAETAADGMVSRVLGFFGQRPDLSQ
jgi:hypothetical protein